MSTIEDLKLYNKVLYLLHRALVDIRYEAYRGSNCDVKKVAEIADIFEAMPMYIFMSKDTSWIDAFISQIDRYINKYSRGRNYKEVLQMDYHEFVEKHLHYTLRDDEPIDFPQKERL